MAVPYANAVGTAKTGESSYSAAMSAQPSAEPLSAEVAAVAEALETVAPFRVLGADGIARVARAGFTRRYGAGQIIFHRGDPGEALYAVLDGLVKVVFTTERGDEIVLNTLGRGETFGELALLDGGPRSASIVTVRPTWAFALPRPQLLALMRERPALTDEFLRMLGGQVRRLTERAADAVFLDLAGRLAKLLLRLAEPPGAGGTGGGGDGAGERAEDRVTDGAVVDRGLTQSDLAALIGASRPAVNRALQSLAARGFIEIRGRVIVLRNVAALRRRAGL